MERAIQQLKRKLEERGVLDFEEFWLKKQPIDVVRNLEREMEVTSLHLWFYSTEFLRFFCYDGRQDPPQWELLQKTYCFIQQLNASNWNLSFTESGHPLVVDIPLAGARTDSMGLGE